MRCVEADTLIRSVSVVDLLGTSLDSESVVRVDNKGEG